MVNGDTATFGNVAFWNCRTLFPSRIKTANREIGSRDVADDRAADQNGPHARNGYDLLATDKAANT